MTGENITGYWSVCVVLLFKGIFNLAGDLSSFRSIRQFCKYLHLHRFRFLYKQCLLCPPMVWGSLHLTMKKTQNKTYGLCFSVSLINIAIVALINTVCIHWSFTSNSFLWPSHSCWISNQFRFLFFLNFNLNKWLGEKKKKDSFGSGLKT